MKQADGWWWPDGERHMLDWIADPKNRMILNGRPSYQGKKQVAVLDALGKRRGTMVDVGAHIGLWSYNFAHWMQKIEAFEPAGQRACFVRNFPDDEWIAASDMARPDKVHVGKKVTLYPFALGEKHKLVSIRVNPSSTGDSWVDEQAPAGKANVEQRTLDSFAFEDVDLIKVDCEGYEEFVLRVAVETIKRWKPVICVEQKRDMARKFDLKPLGALTYLYSLGLGYTTVTELSGDYILKVVE